MHHAGMRNSRFVIRSLLSTYVYNYCHFPFSPAEFAGGADGLVFGLEGPVLGHDSWPWLHRWQIPGQVRYSVGQNQVTVGWKIRTRFHSPCEIYA